MQFQPNAGDVLNIDGIVFQIAPHPAATDLPYGQEGRQAVVYQLRTGPGMQALKVFKARYRVPALVALADKLAPFADLPGLTVCRRTVLTARRHTGLLREHPDLTYAVLMPWVSGPTWLEVICNQQLITAEQSLSLARAFAELLAGLEERGIAHCDLSGPNMLVPSFIEFTTLAATAAIELVDVEQLFGPGLDRPPVVPGGSPGYAHRTASAGLWGTDADRFAGAVLLAEMLGWCDDRTRTAAWGESYFAPAEMQQTGTRFRTLRTVLAERWGVGVAGLFERAWHSETLADCPTFGEWLVALPEQLPTPVAAGVDLPATEELSLVEVLSAGTQTAASLKVSGTATSASNLDRLFADGLVAYRRGDWVAARELLADVVRQAPTYQQGRDRAAALLAEADRRAARVQQPARQWAWLAGPVGLLVVFLLIAAIIASQAENTLTEPATLTTQVSIQTPAREVAATAQAVQAGTQQAQTTAQAAGTATTQAAQASATAVALVRESQASDAATAQAVQAVDTAQAIAGAATAHAQQTAYSQTNAVTAEAGATNTAQAVAAASAQETAQGKATIVRAQAVAAVQTQEAATARAARTATIQVLRTQQAAAGLATELTRRQAVASMTAVSQITLAQQQAAAAATEQAQQQLAQQQAAATTTEQARQELAQQELAAKATEQARQELVHQQAAATATEQANQQAAQDHAAATATQLAADALAQQARATRTAQSRPQSFGPTSGTIELGDTGSGTGGGTFPTGVFVRDVVAEVQFINPFKLDAKNRSWYYSLVARSAGNEYAAFSLHFDGGWSYILVNPATNTTIAHSGWIKVDTNANGSNSLRVIMQGQSGQFFVNGTRVATFDLSGIMDAGDVKVGASESQVERLVPVRFENLTVRPLP